LFLSQLPSSSLDVYSKTAYTEAVLPYKKKEIVFKVFTYICVITH